MEILTMNIQYKLAEFVVNFFRQVHPFSTIGRWSFDSSFQKIEQKIVKVLLKIFIRFLVLLDILQNFLSKAELKLLFLKVCQYVYSRDKV